MKSDNEGDPNEERINLIPKVTVQPNKLLNEDPDEIQEVQSEKFPLNPDMIKLSNESTKFTMQSLNPDQAMEMLNSWRLRFIVYVLISSLNSYNSMFNAAIPFLTEDPKFFCQQPDGSYVGCTKDQACNSVNYIIDRENSYKNFVTELNLECDDGIKITVLTVVAFASNWIGSFIFNMLGDKFGRLKITKFGTFIAIILYLPYFLPFNYYLVIFYMFLFGFINAYYLQAYILGVEFTSSENREFFTIVAQSTDGFYSLVTVIIFCFTKNYLIFMISGFVIGLTITLLMFLFVPESPRYYVAKGDNKNAFKVYAYLAKLHPDPQVKRKIAELQAKAEEVNLNENEEDIPFSKQIRFFIKTKKRTFLIIIIALTWFVNILQQYGLNMQLKNLQGDILINAALTNGTAFLACYLCYPIILYAKRKPSQIIGFILTLVSSLMYVFAESVTYQYILVMIMRFGISLTFTLIYCFTTEMYPTQIRGLAFGIANLFGRIGTMVAAGIINLDNRIFMWMNVFECTVIIILTFFLPETKGLELVDRIEEEEEKEEDDELRQSIQREEEERERQQDMNGNH